MGDLKRKDGVERDLASGKRHLLDDITRLAAWYLDLSDLDVLKSGLLQLSLHNAYRFPLEVGAQVCDRQGAV